MRTVSPITSCNSAGSLRFGVCGICSRNLGWVERCGNIWLRLPASSSLTSTSKSSARQQRFATAYAWSFLPQDRSKQKGDAMDPKSSGGRSCRRYRSTRPQRMRRTTCVHQVSTSFLRSLSELAYAVSLTAGTAPLFCTMARTSWTECLWTRHAYCLMNAL